MKLIVDSGSTKTLWCLVEQGRRMQEISTEGINPFITSSDKIGRIIQQDLIPNLLQKPTDIFYYGAGCSNETNNSLVEDQLRFIASDIPISVESDLLAVARALCHREAGIATILGTGSNSCLYDGEGILEQVPSLGYILGDEGSGANIGKKILAEILYGLAPKEIIQSYFETYNESLDDILFATYKAEKPNAFLASKLKWLGAWRNHSYVHELISNSFNEFIRKHLMQYDKSVSNEVHSVGSIAFHFREIWEECLKENGFKPGRYLAEPIDGLIIYHK
jgi:N-acetylglucosamine kinase-like BadF-type ATPase